VLLSISTWVCLSIARDFGATVDIYLGVPFDTYLGSTFNTSDTTQAPSPWNNGNRFIAPMRKVNNSKIQPFSIRPPSNDNPSISNDDRPNLLEISVQRSGTTAPPSSPVTSPPVSPHKHDASGRTETGQRTRSSNARQKKRAGLTFLNEKGLLADSGDLAAHNELRGNDAGELTSAKRKAEEIEQGYHYRTLVESTKRQKLGDGDSSKADQESVASEYKTEESKETYDGPLKVCATLGSSAVVTIKQEGQDDVDEKL
jgi:hypothetical protein